LVETTQGQGNRQKRPSLFGAVGKGLPEAAAGTDAPPPAPEESRQTAVRAAPRGRQDRQDKRQIAGFFSAECARQLRMLAAEKDTTVQELLKGGLNMMFVSHGKPPIA
jgi:antitoxin-like ribbon-helix-helix protein